MSGCVFSSKKEELAALYTRAIELEEATQALACDIAQLRVKEAVWYLYRIPLVRFMQTLKSASKGARQQLEQLLWDGDPFYTGGATPEERLVLSREVYRRGKEAAT